MFMHLQTYLKFEHSSGDPARIQVLYERAISEFPISTDLWLDYTQYLDKTFKVLYFIMCLILYSYLFIYIVLSLHSHIQNCCFADCQNCEGCLLQGHKELSLGRRVVGSLLTRSGTKSCSRGRVIKCMFLLFTPYLL